jgi:hypothetical protein
MLNTKTITIRGGRDDGKMFVITEMPARPAYRWALRALFALMNSGVEVPEDIQAAGMAAIAALGIKALGNASFAAMEPLLDEMLACVSFVPDPSKSDIRLNDIERHIEDAKTFFTLQKETVTLHLAPFMQGVVSNGASTPQMPHAG